jgi:hypothetical protein
MIKSPYARGKFFRNFYGTSSFRKLSVFNLRKQEDASIDMARMR